MSCPKAGLSDKTITIVGLGLMGGSLAAALASRRVCRQVLGVARRQEVVREALDRGIIDAGGIDVEDAVSRSQMVILATPPRIVLSQLGEIAPHQPKGSILMDLASTKAEIVRAMCHLPAHVHPIGGHPMCGKTLAGIHAADGQLFVGRNFVLTPLERTPADVIETARALAEAIGSVPYLMDAETHDRTVAWVSHLPHMVAAALIRAGMDGEKTEPDIWNLAASGFRDTTRLAASDLTMMLDIFFTNREALLHASRAFASQLGKMIQLLEAGDEAGLRALLSEVVDRRRKLG